MDALQLIDLYAAETQEHLGLLQRSLLSLERDASQESLHEAFRAAHTIKGLAGAMGYQEVAGRAHSLEDVLAGIRQGKTACTPTLLDALLKGSDELQRAVARATAEPAADPLQLPGPVVPAATPPRRPPPVPPGTCRVIEVTLRREAPLKTARAVLILRTIQARTPIMGWAPDPLPDDFDGILHIFLDAASPAETVQALARSAGDVESVTMAELSDAVSAASAPGAAAREVAGMPARAAARRERQVRVAESGLDQLADGVAELAVLRHRLGQAALDAGAAGMVARMGQLLDELQRQVLAMRMLPLREVFERLPRVVRDAGREAGREVALELEGEDIELDRAILGEIFDPLAHLVRNAVAHGIESESLRARRGKAVQGCVTVRAEREHNGVCITVQDDGAGVDRAAAQRRAEEWGLLPRGGGSLADEELLRLLARPGFSLATRVTGVSGRGVGLDVVLTRVRALGGAVEMRSVPGQGTSFLIKVPVTLALAQALWVRVAGEDYAMALTHLRETLDLAGAVERDGEREVVRLRDQLVPLVRLRRALGSADHGEELSAVVAQVGERRIALAVDELVGHERILVKSFVPAPGTLAAFTGATLRADGRPALVLDPLALEAS